MKRYPTLVVRVDDSAHGEPRVLAPAVGTWTDPPPGGSAVGPGSPVGYLRRLNRRFVLQPVFHLHCVQFSRLCR